MATNTTNKAIYFSPSIKVIQLMGQNMICETSDPTTTGPGGEDGGSLDG